MEKIMKNKDGLELVTSRFSGYITSQENFFELFQKLNLIIYASQVIISYIIQVSFVLLNLQSVKRKKITKENLNI